MELTEILRTHALVKVGGATGAGKSTVVPPALLLQTLYDTPTVEVGIVHILPSEFAGQLHLPECQRDRSDGVSR